jgi:hypothetical protein
VQGSGARGSVQDEPQVVYAECCYLWKGSFCLCLWMGNLYKTSLKVPVDDLSAEAPFLGRHLLFIDWHLLFIVRGNLANRVELIVASSFPMEHQARRCNPKNTPSKNRYLARPSWKSLGLSPRLCAPVLTLPLLLLPLQAQIGRHAKQPPQRVTGLMAAVRRAIFCRVPVTVLYW